MMEVKCTLHENIKRQISQLFYYLQVLVEIYKNILCKDSRVKLYLLE